MTAAPAESLFEVQFSVCGTLSRLVMAPNARAARAMAEVAMGAASFGINLDEVDEVCILDCERAP